MTIRVNKTRDFSVIANHPLNDASLDWECRGLLAYLLSKPDGWQIQTHQLIKAGTAGKDKVLRILKDLETVGYIKRAKTRDLKTGHFVYVSEVYEIPDLKRINADDHSSESITTTDEPREGHSTAGKPSSGEARCIIKTERTMTERVNTEEEKEPDSDFEFAAIDQQERSPNVSTPLPQEISFSEQPDRKKEPVNLAEQEYGNDRGSEINPIQDNAAAPRNTRKLLFGGKSLSDTMKLVAIGESRSLWKDQPSLAAFQHALRDELERLGRKEPARAFNAIFKGVQNQSIGELEEVAGYWARFDGEKILPEIKESLPWVGVDGQILSEYRAWAKVNIATLDGKLADGTYKSELILQTKSSNKIAIAAWEGYQKYLAIEAAHERQRLAFLAEDAERAAALVQMQEEAANPELLSVETDDPKVIAFREKFAKFMEAKQRGNRQAS